MDTGVAHSLRSQKGQSILPAESAEEAFPSMRLEALTLGAASYLSGWGCGQQLLNFLQLLAVLLNYESSLEYAGRRRDGTSGGF
jgi:hypothetical protein